MKLAVYRLKTDGKISRAYEQMAINEPDDVQQAITVYNMNPDHKDTVEVVELNELEIFLYNRAELNIKKYKDDIENMSCTLYELEKSLDWLCDKVKDTDAKGSL